MFIPTTKHNDIQSDTFPTISADYLLSKLKTIADSNGVELTEEHVEAANSLLVDRRNTFLTGGAGTGKSTFLTGILVPFLELEYINYSMTASTGGAASIVKGRTLHSWSGIQLGPKYGYRKNAMDYIDVCDGSRNFKMLDTLYRDTYDQWSNSKSKSKGGIRSRIKNCQILIIEEVSQLGGESLLGYLNFFFQKIRNSTKPFGGIRILMVGDFAQIPPVSFDQPLVDWAFLSRAWEDAKVNNVLLTHIYRQDDPKFIDFLNHIRRGGVMSTDVHNYISQFVPTNPEEDNSPTHLVPTNSMADTINARALTKIEGDSYIIDAEFTVRDKHCYGDPEKVKKQLDSSTKMKRRLELKVGSDVLICINDPEGEYVNGTRGVITQITQNDSEVISVSVDIAQDGAPSNIKRFGRVTTTRGNHEPAEEIDAYATNAEIEKYGGEVPAWPCMSQFPVIPSSAVTIHSSQGMSLDKASVDLKHSFAPGQAYVGLSRLRTPEGLTLLSTDFEALVDPDVATFYDKLELTKLCKV